MSKTQVKPAQTALYQYRCDKCRKEMSEPFKGGDVVIGHIQSQGESFPVTAKININVSAPYAGEFDICDECAKNALDSLISRKDW